MAKTEAFSVEQVREAIENKTGGIVLAIATNLKCDCGTVYNYLKRYPSLEKIRLAEKEKLIDRAEAKLQELINNGEQSAIFFFLKCQAKHRGYVERQEFAGVQDAPITINVVPCLPQINNGDDVDGGNGKELHIERHIPFLSQ